VANMVVRRGRWTDYGLVLFLFVGFRLSLLASWLAEQL